MIEVSTARDERVDRWEYYENDVMVRVEEDTTGDGQADRWSTFVDGVLAARGETPVEFHHGPLDQTSPR